jgi:hypothetical protein
LVTRTITPRTLKNFQTTQTNTEIVGSERFFSSLLGEDKARNEIFNVSNGDVYRWRQLWNELAAFYDLPIAEPLAMSTVSEMSEQAPFWDMEHYFSGGFFRGSYSAR